MSALVAAGYRVIAPNQRGYGRSSKPSAVEDYDITHLAGDITGLMDELDIERAVTIGHDWGAIVNWQLAQLAPERIIGTANLSVPYQDRGTVEPISFWHQHLGDDFYIVHFNHQPGVADAVFDANTENFLRNMYRHKQWEGARTAPPSGMPLLHLAQSTAPSGKPMMSEAELAVFVDAFLHSGFTGGINWYRNFTRNWQLMANVEPNLYMPTLMIHGTYDSVPQNKRMPRFVHDLEMHELPCGHWIQQECPDATNDLIIDWLQRRVAPLVQ